MPKQRRNFSGAQKMAILRQHLIAKVPISEVCDKHGLQPTVFYQWQRKLFEDGAAFDVPFTSHVLPLGRSANEIDAGFVQHTALPHINPVEQPLPPAVNIEDPLQPIPEAEHLDPIHAEMIEQLAMPRYDDSVLMPEMVDQAMEPSVAAALEMGIQDQVRDPMLDALDMSLAQAAPVEGLEAILDDPFRHAEEPMAYDPMQMRDQMLMRYMQSFGPAAPMGPMMRTSEPPCHERPPTLRS